MPVTVVTTDADGRFETELDESTDTDLAVQAWYDSDDTYWPALGSAES